MLEVDESVFRLIYDGGSSPSLVLLMLVLTAIGSGWAALGVVPLIAARRTRSLGVALACVLAAQGITVWALKLLVQRVRPWRALALSVPLDPPTDFSFPSGHAAGAFAAAAFLATLL